MSPEHEPAKPAARRPFIGMLFRCCHVYARVYLNADKTAYEGGCPRCGAPVRIGVKPGGSSSRFWTAG